MFTEERKSGKQERKKSKGKNVSSSLMCDEPVAEAQAAALPLDGGYLVP